MLVLCGLAAGCSQTPSEPAAVTQKQSRPAATKRTVAGGDRCLDAVRQAAQTSQNAAMAGMVLSAAGSLGGFAGRGGAIAGQVASVGGSAMQAQARGKSTAALEDCR